MISLVPNANAINGNKAEWHMLKVSQMREVYVKRETPFLSGLGVFKLCVFY